MIYSNLFEQKLDYLKKEKFSIPISLRLVSV